MSGGSRGAGPTAVLVQPVGGIGEVLAGADLGAVIGAALVAARVRDGDILAVTIEGHLQGIRGQVAERARRSGGPSPSRLVRVVAERMTATGATRIVEGHHGVVMAAAGSMPPMSGRRVRCCCCPDDPDPAASDLLQPHRIPEVDPGAKP